MTGYIDDDDYIDEKAKVWRLYCDEKYLTIWRLPEVIKAILASETEDALHARAFLNWDNPLLRVYEDKRKKE